MLMLRVLLSKLNQLHQLASQICPTAFVEVHIRVAISIYKNKIPTNMYQTCRVNAMRFRACDVIAKSFGLRLRAVR